MSNKFDPPSVDKIKQPEKPVEDKLKTDPIPGDKVPTTLKDIYKKDIDNFTSFIKCEYKSADQSERTQAQLDFIRIFNDILEADYQTVDYCLDYFIEQINSNPAAYQYEHVLSPFFGMKVKPNESISEPYLKFISFITSLASNVRNRDRFIKGFDVVKFLSYWNEKQKQNLHRYIYR